MFVREAATDWQMYRCSECGSGEKVVVVIGSSELCICCLGSAYRKAEEAEKGKRDAQAGGAR